MENYRKLRLFIVGEVEASANYGYLWLEKYKHQRITAIYYWEKWVDFKTCTTLSWKTEFANSHIFWCEPKSTKEKYINIKHCNKYKGKLRVRIHCRDHL